VKHFNNKTSYIQGKLFQLKKRTLIQVGYYSIQQRMTCPILFRNYRVILNKAINVPFKKNILFCNLSQPNWVNGKRFLNNTTSNTAQPISHTAEEIGQGKVFINYPFFLLVYVDGFLYHKMKNHL